MRALDMLRTAGLRRAVERALPLVASAVAELRTDEETPDNVWLNLEAARAALDDALRESDALECSRPAMRRARDELACACVEMDAAILRGEVGP